MPETTFEAADIAEQFQVNADRLSDLLSEAGSERLEQLDAKLHDDLTEHHENNLLSVAFIGQYSAGKSTIISALTGRRDIKIDADIATDSVTTYHWNEIELIDTPGLYTEREEHDALTYEAIRKADLLVFTLTYMLFDPITLENFKELAYQEGFRNKMMLVVNKMADEAGDIDERITNYRKSLQESLGAHDLDAFDLHFVDALDYIEGLEYEDDFLIEESRFNHFIEGLNTFVDERGKLGRLDTPLRILLGVLDDASDAIMRDEVGDDAYLELLSRVERKVERERKRFRRKVEGEILELTSEIHDIGQTLAAQIGSLEEEELQNKLEQRQNDIERKGDEVTKAFQEHIEEASSRLADEVGDVLTSDLAADFAASAKRTDGVEAEAPSQENPWGDRREKWKTLEEIGEKAGVTIQKAATSSSSAASGFLNASEVAQSQMHKVVYNVGKFLGAKFKPWQAVNIAKHIGNVAKIAGPVLNIVGVAMEVGDRVKDAEHAVKLEEARGDLIAEFKELADKYEQNFIEERKDAEKKIFGKLKNEIDRQRRQAEREIARGDELITELNDIRKNTESLLDKIHKAG